MSKEKQEHCCSACGIDYSVYTALLEACKGMVKHFEFAEMNTLQHLMLKHVKAAIAVAVK